MAIMTCPLSLAASLSSTSMTTSGLIPFPFAGTESDTPTSTSMLEQVTCSFTFLGGDFIFLAGGDLTFLDGGDLTFLDGGDLTVLAGGDVTFPSWRGLLFLCKELLVHSSFVYIFV